MSKNMQTDDRIFDVEEPKTMFAAESEMESELEILPCVALRGVSIFPNTVVHFDIGREKSIRALERAMSGNKLMYVATQVDDNILIPTVDDMYKVGAVVRVKQMLKIQGDAVRVLVEGICRATIQEALPETSYI